MLVVEKFLRSGKYGRIWLVKCDCGEFAERRGAPLNAKQVLSCGCLHKEGPKRLARARRQHTTYSDDPNVRLIQLTQGQVTRIGAHRYDEFACHNWFAYWNPKTRSFYAVRMSETVGGEKHIIYLHREIMGVGYLDPREVDHIEPDETLDNVDSNLRLANDNQQEHNKRKYKNNTSGYKGVYYHTASGLWMAVIWSNGARISLGSRKDPEVAWRELYVPAALKYHGDRARVA